MIKCYTKIFSNAVGNQDENKCSKRSRAATVIKYGESVFSPSLIFLFLVSAREVKQV